MTRIERVTSPLPRECSATELHGQKFRASTVAGAGEGNRTLVVSLEGFCSAIELHPPDSTVTQKVLPVFRRTSIPHVEFRGRPNLVEGVGFEPT